MSLLNFIVVNDASTDDIGNVIRQICDDRLILIEQSNQGATPPVPVPAAGRPGWHRWRCPFVLMRPWSQNPYPGRWVITKCALVNSAGENGLCSSAIFHAAPSDKARSVSPEQRR